MPDNVSLRTIEPSEETLLVEMLERRGCFTNLTIEEARRLTGTEGATAEQLREAIVFLSKFWV